MTRLDNQSKVSKKDLSKHNKKEESLKQKRKKDESSDSDEYDGSDDSESDEMDVQEYRKFLSKIFPSKHLNKKINAGEKVKEVFDKKKKQNKKSVQEDEEEGCESEEEENPKPISKVNTISKTIPKVKTNKRNKKRVHEEESEDEEEVWETASESEEEAEEEKPKSKKSKKNKKKVESESEETLGSEDSEEEEDYDDVVKLENKKGSKNKFNIIFTIGGTENEEYDEEEYYDSEEDSDYSSEEEEETEDEDEPVSSDSDSDTETEDEEEEKNVIKTRSSKNKEKSGKNKQEKNTEEKENPLSESKNLEMIAKFKDMLETNPNNKYIQKCIKYYEKDIKKQKHKEEKKVKKHKDKNLRIFKKIIKDKNTMNDYKFYEKLEVDEQNKIIKELREINKITRIEKPYRITLLEANIPTIFKGAAMKKINSLRYMEPGSGEFYKIKNWVDTFMRIPFNKFQSLPLTIEDGVDKCHDFMENAKNTLDKAVYGLNDAKMQIMQMLGQLITNPKSIGTAIAIHGPPGTGKTSLVKEGISKILNRPFAFIALGGATDSSFLEGHSYTYEGSMWGKIVQIIIDSTCMNPVIYFDELDKISETPRGEEIAGILTHLTDTSQNSQFHDKYFAEINFDLSKCLFIFSYNDETKVNPILKDRMYRIQTKGYNLKQKTVISNDYLLPRIREQVKFNTDEIIIPDETLHYIVDTHCNKEDGVRNLKRCLEIIYTKLNLYRLMKPGSNLFEEDMSLKVTFPFTVTRDIVDKMIKTNKDQFTAWHTMFI
jgi:ATP-dependent Lon protease